MTAKKKTKASDGLIYITLLCFALTIQTSCGVEVGNPGSDDPPASGSISVYFSKNASNAQESLSLRLKSIGIAEGDSQEVVSSLTPSIAEIDLFELTGNNSAVISSASVPVGTYDQILVQLDDTKPMTYRNNDGESEDVTFEDDSQSAFYISQNFEVNQGETTEIVITLDPRRSISTEEQTVGGELKRRHIFKPFGDARHKKFDTTFPGSTDALNAQWVCAYGYTIKRPSFQRRPPPRTAPGRKRPPGPTIHKRPSFGSKTDVVLDTTHDCENAFARAAVVAGEYEIRHLLPGRYIFRVFSEDGSYVDSVEEIRPELLEDD